MITQKILDEAIRGQVNLERLKAGEAERFAVFLREIDTDIRKRLAGGELTAFSRARLERLLAATDEALAEIFGRYRDSLSDNLLDIADAYAKREAKALTASAAAVAEFEAVVPSFEQLRSAVMTAPLSVRGPDGGKLLEPFIDDWIAAEKSAITGAIRQGYFEGQTNQQITQRIRGTKKNGYRDGILNTTTKHAQAIGRTAIQHSASVARMEVLKENDDVCSGYRFVATLDSRTSPQCRALDGIEYEFGKGPTPPIHIGCRSTIVPELDEEFDWLSEGSTRSSIDGAVDADITYYDWLKDRSAGEQDEILGKTKGAIFRNEDMSAEKFRELNMDKYYQPTTLASLRESHPEWF